MVEANYWNSDVKIISRTRDQHQNQAIWDQDQHKEQWAKQ